MGEQEELANGVLGREPPEIDDGSAIEEEENISIGIRFGNSYSTLAYMTGDGKTEIIANQEGDRQIPSVLSYVDGEEFHGTQARSQLVKNPQNTVTRFRDFLGKRFDEVNPALCEGSAQPKESNSQICFSIQDSGSPEVPHDVTVGTLTERHISRLVASASDYLGKKVNSVVILAPHGFTDEQKSQLAKACHAANVQLLYCFNEAVCALYVYDSINAPFNPLTGAGVNDKTVLVADFGATRSDVTVISDSKGLYGVIGEAHSDEFGGVALDVVLVDHFAKEFLKKHKQSADPRNNPRSLQKLKLECDATRRALSIGTSATFFVESLVDGIDFSSTINRTRFELLAKPVFERFTALVYDGVRDARIDFFDVNEVILIGGTSHTPRLAVNMRQLFRPEVPIIAPATYPSAFNPNEVAARGAAMQVNLLQASGAADEDEINDYVGTHLTEAPFLQHDLGVAVVPSPSSSLDPSSGEDQETSLTPIALKDTPIPLRRTQTLRLPAQANQAVIRLWEGTRYLKQTPISPKAEIANGKMHGSDEEDDNDNGIGLFSDEEGDGARTPETVAEREWKQENLLAEMKIESTKPGGKVELSVTVNMDRSVQMVARESGSGGKGKVVKGLVEP
ncbi:MAG: hypothetical protein LQ351_006908 [Letrouitia transgressa]|nr:MAG: hypothetical protein LQ351_006908 [Letrouitia transgressa]